MRSIVSACVIVLISGCAGENKDSLPYCVAYEPVPTCQEKGCVEKDREVIIDQNNAVYLDQCLDE